ncbi:hypothetical protein SUGI_0635650 [Cryptomeria japonica]|nr:hypothetical protein SUGI_0635650 [Cryptomeria japonica]
MFWRQKSKETWLTEGDKNSKKIHNSTKQRRNVNRIRSLKKEDGIIIEDLEEIVKYFVHFFTQILNNWEGSNWKNIPKLVTREQNCMLTKKFTIEEIKVALFQLHPDKTPGLKCIFLHIVSEEWMGFFVRRSIMDGVVITQEAIHSIQCNKSPSMLIKLDIKKAYDKVDWRFLCKCLDAFGFNKKWVNWIFHCISSLKFSILINGASTRFFESSGRIRQRDPLSPFLFIILVEALGRALRFSQERGLVIGVKITSGLLEVTRQQFVDDTMLFDEGRKREALQMRNILRQYVLALGQEINQLKLEVFFFSMESRKEIEIFQSLGFKVGKLPCIYLGLPLDKGVRSNKLWDPLKERMESRLSSWKGKWLSWAGRLTMLRFVISSFPIYLLSCLPLSKWMNSKPIQLMRKLFWQGNEEKKKMEMISWKKICKPKEFGGIGLRNQIW